MKNQNFSADKNLAVIQEMIECNKLRKKIISNYDYIKWLEEFTVKYTSFLDNEWLYTPEDLLPSDAKNVDKLNYFVEEILSYAKRAHIEIQHGKSFETYVTIKYNDIGYIVGYMAGQGVVFFVTRVPVPNDCIDFSDIVENIIRTDTEKIELALKKFNTSTLAEVNKLKSMGIPLEEISSILYDILKELD